MSRRRFTYQNVMATLALLLLFAGGTAFAASKLGKNSVGSKQLKKNSVTAAKIKKNAVTNGKLKKNAVTTAKIADRGVKGADIDAATTPYSRIVARLATPGPTPFADSKLGPVMGTYTQPAGEIDEYVSYVDFTFAPTCTGERVISVYLLVDVGSEPTEDDIAAVGTFFDEGGTIPSGRIELTGLPQLKPLISPASSSPVTHDFTLYMDKVDCKTGTPGATIDSAGIEVIGTPPGGGAAQ